MTILGLCFAIALFGLFVCSIIIHKRSNKGEYAYMVPLVTVAILLAIAITDSRIRADEVRAGKTIKG